MANAIRLIDILWSSQDRGFSFGCWKYVELERGGRLFSRELQSERATYVTSA